jgi:hypothetical protein
MAKDAIVEKLRALLNSGIDSEATVVYLLCEVRKLFEKTPASDRPFALNMYCHWALHVDLTGPDTVLPFLRQVDAYIHGVIVGPEDFSASDQMVREFLMLDTFRTQLRTFLDGHGLPTDLTTDDGQWNRFVTRYAGVIDDGSLLCRSTKRNDLKHVKQVTFARGRSAAVFRQLPFDMTWVITLQDNRQFDVSVNARPAGANARQMFGWSIHLRNGGQPIAVAVEQSQ